MGALSAPECDRLVAAFDLAERLQVPLEWVAVSSGARIAMDSGTENLDSTARVVRRIVTFTQAGGEVNLIVARERAMWPDRRLLDLLNIEIPIIQAPMSWIARAQLASAVCNAGGLGIIETGSGELDAIRGEVLKMRELTDKPFGMNVALAFVKGSDFIDFVIEQNLPFVTTSSGSPAVCTEIFQQAGIKVFHVVPTLDMALKAIDCGVDGLIVEGGEGGGFKNPNPVSLMVLLPLIRSRTDIPIIAAGGICDGPSMAAAFAMGAEGVQMGTRMLSSAESPVHQNWKQAVVEAKETDTVFLNQQSRPALRALRTERTAALQPLGAFDFREQLAGVQELYFGGDMEAAIPLSGQVVGRIDVVQPVAEVIQSTMTGFYESLGHLQDYASP